MKRNQQFLTALAVAMAAAIGIAACGGGSSGSSATSTPSPTQSPSAASGVLTAFGSIFVNGSEYATNGSTSVVDGDNDDASSSASALQVGMTVDVDATSGGAASLVRFTSAVRGEVDAVSSSANTLTVLGQAIQLTSATSFAGANAAGSVTGLGSISVGDYVTVYGYLQCTSTTTTCSSADVVATLVYDSGTGSVYRVEGYAQVSGTATDSFTINGLTVNYTSSGTSATVCMPTPCAITNGTFVAVRSATAPSGSLAGNNLTLTATSIRSATQAPVFAVGSTVSIEGPVAQLNMTADTFDVRALLINGTGLASTVATLSDGQIVVVTGTIQSDGSILATAISVKRFATFALMAPLDSANLSTTTLSVLGQVFTVNSDTRFVDWDKGVRPFNSTNFSSVLSPGDQLLVSGYSTSAGDVATRVERIPTPALPIVGAQGIVTADSGTSTSDTLTIGGVVATLGSTTTLWYQGADGSPTLAGLLGAVAVNTSVATVIGTETGTGAIAAIGAAVMPNPLKWAPVPH
jgi:hypothetical protein